MPPEVIENPIEEPGLVWTDIVGEKSRTYVFENSCYTIPNVVKLCVRPSGNHRVEDANGMKYIVMAGFFAIEIDAEKWTA